MKTKIKIAIIAMIGIYVEVEAQEIIKYDDSASYPTQISRGNIFQLYQNSNQTLELGVAGGLNTRRSWILSRHLDLSGTYGRYYSTLHLQPDTGDKSQYRGVAIGFNAESHIGVGTHLAVNGNVGIGTNAPSEKLEVKEGDVRIYGVNTSRYIRFGEVNYQGAFINYDGTTNVLNIGVNNVNTADTNNDYNAISIVRSGGNVGIGTTSPSEKLEVKDGNIRIEGLNTSRYIRFGEVNYQGAFINYDGTTNVLNIGVNNVNAAEVSNDYNAISIIRSSGKVGIGTTTTGSHKLAVEGSIGAREIKVEGSGWSDFVFENTYNLSSLQEVEAHIKEKGHLKDIPSAKEVEKNGFYLGAMDAKLLQKIEELTLYTIQQEKKINNQKNKLDNQKENLKDYKELLNQQANEIEKLKELVRKILKESKL